MYNQFFFQGESARRTHRLFSEAEADQLARAGRLRRLSGDGLGKRVRSAIGALFIRRRRRASKSAGTLAPGSAQVSAQVSASAEQVAHAGSDTASPAHRGDLVAS